MTTLQAIAQARAEQAAADLAAAEAALVEVMVGIDARPTIPLADGVLPRRFEALLEGINPHKGLAAAYGVYRRALRAEAKAQRAAICAQAAPAPAPTPKPARRLRKPAKVAFVDHAREILADARAA